MLSRKLRRVPGISPEIVEKLAKHNIFTCKELLQRNHLELLKFTGASYTEVLGIQKAASRAITPRAQTALAILQRSKHQKSFLATSLDSLDEQLHGGIACGTITEITGPAGAGKTQFCIMLSVLATLPLDEGGMDASVIYIDTEAAFSAKRLIEMASKRFPDVFSTNEALLKLSERIHVYWESTCSSLWDRLQTLEEDIISKRVKLVILDSVASLVRKEFDSRVTKNLSGRTALLSKEAAILKYLAETFHIPVLVTNQITTRFASVGNGPNDREEFHDVDDTEAEPDGDDGGHVTAALGNTWSHAVNTRLILQYYGGEFRQILIAKSPVAPFSSFLYTIQAEGIVLERWQRLQASEQDLGGNPSLQLIQVRSALSSEAS